MPLQPWTCRSDSGPSQKTQGSASANPCDLYHRHLGFPVAQDYRWSRGRMWRRGGSHAGAAWPDNAPSGKRTTVIAVSPHWRAPAAVALAASREREIEQKAERERERERGRGESTPGEGRREPAAALPRSCTPSPSASIERGSAPRGGGGGRRGQSWEPSERGRSCKEKQDPRYIFVLPDFNAKLEN